MRNRITIHTTDELERALEEVRRATGRATSSEVIRDGLELYDLVVQHLIAGKHLYLGAARESASEVVLPHLECAAGRLRTALADVKRDAASVSLSVVPAPSAESVSDNEAKPAAGRPLAANRRSDSP